MALTTHLPSIGYLQKIASNLLMRTFMKDTKFHIVNIVPQPELHPLYGHAEVIESIKWGLNDLGYKVTTALNTIDPKSTNIICGAQMLSQDAIEALPDSTIVYNLEQVSELNLAANPIARAIAQRCQIWEYSQGNFAKWQELNPKHDLIYVPIGWAPVLDRLGKPQLQDIDVLIYATPGQLRLQIFYELCMRGLACVFVCGLYGQARDDLIARAKIVLNVNGAERNRVFEMVRVSYLLTNAKAVVANLQFGRNVEPGLDTAVAFFPEEQLAEGCISLVRNDLARRDLEIRGQAFMRRRSVTPILRNALNHSSRRCI